MANYAKNHPIDRGQIPLQHYPAACSTLGTIYRDNASASSVTALTANTTVLEIAAAGVPVGIRWAINQATSIIATAGATANFDNIVAPGEVRRFVVPRRTIGIPNYTNDGAPSVVGLNTAEGLFSNVATISLGVGSVMLMQN